ncbi:hypothetical protein [Salibacterium sp. K-3]
MKSIKVHHYDAFSKEANINGDELTEKEMQEIAFEVKLLKTKKEAGYSHS